MYGLHNSRLLGKRKLIKKFSNQIAATVILSIKSSRIPYFQYVISTNQYFDFYHPFFILSRKINMYFQIYKCVYMHVPAKTYVAVRVAYLNIFLLGNLPTYQSIHTHTHTHILYIYIYIYIYIYNPTEMKWMKTWKTLWLSIYKFIGWG